MDTRTEIASRVLAGLADGLEPTRDAARAVAYADALIAALGGAEQMPEGMLLCDKRVSYRHAATGLFIYVELDHGRWDWRVCDAKCALAVGYEDSEAGAVREAVKAACAKALEERR